MLRGAFLKGAVIMKGLINRFKRKEFAPSIDWIIVGLGNPGEKYQRTRHNCGWMAADLLAQSAGARLTRVKFKSLCAEIALSGQRCLLMKPTTYMNASGDAVKEALDFYKLPPERALIISDDVSLDLGRLRIRRKGSDGGQKGLRSIILRTGSDSFPRIRIGIGEKPHPDYDMAAWVLSRLDDGELKTLYGALESCARAAELIVSGDIDRAMSLYNQR